MICLGLAHRLLVVLVLCQALVCLWVALRMVEPPRHATADAGSTVQSAFKITLETARWVFTTWRVLVIIVIGLAIDSIVRNFATLTSSYYRIIALPEWSFGFIGASIGVLGWFAPAIAAKLNRRFGTLTNLGIAVVVSLCGLAALVPAWPWFGLLPAMLLMTTLGYLGFTVSRALHSVADSSKRATVLPVKGMMFNLGYGLFSFGFSRLLACSPVSPPKPKAPPSAAPYCGKSRFSPSSHGRIGPPNCPRSTLARYFGNNPSDAIVRILFVFAGRKPLARGLAS